MKTKTLIFAGAFWTSNIALSQVSATSAPSLLVSGPNESFIEQLIHDQNVGSLEELVGKLPESMRRNFVLKHGLLRAGERGHQVEKKVSQSSDPELPRAILWNENSGFTISYNGGGEKQTANQRADMLSFDPSEKAFHLREIDFPLTEAEIRDRHHSVIKDDAACKECHGPLQRPIFAMYPDWPSFYGSDNDELNNPKAPHQQAELRDYQNFRAHAAVRNLRYSPLFDEDLVQRSYGMPMWDTYPYRQNTSEEAKSVSRAFAFRPGLRLGILYNRLNADLVFAKMKSHPNYAKYGLFTLHSLLQCSWNPKDAAARRVIAEKIAADSKHAPVWIGKDSLQLHYHQIWNLFDLKINDVDIRYSYNHEGYGTIDASKNIMAPGYIGRYFNAYFDGTATIDELISAKLLTDLSTRYPSLRGKYQLRGLTEKYKHLTARFQHDEKLFKNYDRLGLWFAMPYAKAVFAPHHRESYSAEMQQQYQNVCAETQELLSAELGR
jgi:hypothetical protein